MSPYLSAGGSIPISPGGGTSGPATSGTSGSPINIGGLFGPDLPAQHSQYMSMYMALAALAVGVVCLLYRR